MRPIGMTVALALALSAPALATGTVRIQQNDGSVQTYTGVTLKAANKSLTFISRDKVSTVVLSGAQCAPEGALVRCTGGGFEFIQQGKRHAVAVKSDTFYFNMSDRDQALPLSTTNIAAHSVIFTVVTAKGTYVTGKGKLDGKATR